MYPKRLPGETGKPAPAVKTVDPATEEALARERDLKFKQWLQNKAVRDKAFEYLGKLDTSRASEEDSLVEIGVALCAVDRLLGGEETTAPPRSNTGGNTPEVPSSGPQKGGDGTATSKRTLKSAWTKLAMEFYSLSMLKLTSKDLTTISDGVKEFLFSESDLVASSGAPSEEIAKADREKNILPSLKYFFPAVPKPNEKPRPLTSDQKAQNAIYMRELRKVWKRAEEEMNNRVTEYVARGLKAEAENDNESSEKAAKSGSAASSKSNRGEEATAKNRKQAMMVKILETQCLNDLSLRQLRNWIEEDEDSKLKKENEDALEKVKLAKTSHEQFVKKKDSLRIRMPDNIEPPPPQPMAYGRELSGIRATGKPVTSTVELMAGTGLKYVHATNKGRKGVEGDLEKSRLQLLKMGFVDKTNFDEDQRDLFEKEKRNNQVLVEKQKLEQKLKDDNAKAYDEWIVLKDMRDQALKCLGLLPKPVPSKEMIATMSLRRSVSGSIGDWSTTSRANNNATASSGTKSGLNNKLMLNLKDPSDRDSFDRICEIGRNLKRVDRTLFNEWATWCHAVVPSNTAGVLWDFFAPRACDVHSSAYSQVRDSFLKLLRPNVDYRQTFLDFVERTIFSKRAERFRIEKNYYRLEDEIKEELDAELEGLRKEWLQNVSVPREQFKVLLAQMGIVLKDAEMRSLLDAFDVNGDGVVTLVEFLDFCGPKRDKRSGNSLILNQRCCWITTCSVTGMPNGYSVSNATKRFLKQEAEQQRKRRGEKRSAAQRYADDVEDEENAKGNQDEENFKLNAAFTGTVVIKKLATGEQRMCVELADRIRREELLKRLGLIDDPEKKNKRKHKKSSNIHAKKERADKRQQDRGGPDSDHYSEDEDHQDEDEGDDYEDDYEDDADHDKSKSKVPGGSVTGSVAVLGPCEVSTWQARDRRVGLRYLLDVSKELREEEALKVLIANGKAPQAPRLWIQFDKQIETRARNRLAITQGNSNTTSNTNNNNSAEARQDHDSLAREIQAVSAELDIDPTSEVVLYWGPQQSGELVSFYSIECAGAITINTKLGDAKYTEIFRDPAEADDDATFACQYRVSNLTPGTSYLFRIRAFNGFGPSDYTYKTFTTLTTPPLQPRAIKIAAESVVLRWTFSKVFFQRLEELRHIFVMVAGEDGKVSREELALTLDDGVGDTHALKSFLASVVKSSNKRKDELGSDRDDQKKGGRGAYAGLFDLIETNDDGYLSWEEFENFFLSAGWTNIATATNGNPNGATGPRGRGSVEGSEFGGSQNMSATASNNNNNKRALDSGNDNVRPGDVVYVVEKCESEFDDTYKEVLRTTNGQAFIKGLEPGNSYRFRVYSMNADSLPGPVSPSVLVHTLLETPAPPQPAVPASSSSSFTRAIKAHSIALTWKARNYVTNTRTKAFTDKMLSDWTHAHYLHDGGVSIDKIFEKYDTNRNGEIDEGELANVLRDLGVEPTQERLAVAFQQMDSNSDGTITFEEFAAWWRRQDVMYSLRRSEPIQPLSRQALSASTAPSVNNSVVLDGTFTAELEESTRKQQSARASSSSRGQRRPSLDASVNLNASTTGRALSRTRSRPGTANVSGGAGLSNTAAALSSTNTSEGISGAVVYSNPAPHLRGKMLPTTRVEAVPMTCAVCPADTTTRFDVKGLLPNSMYHFRVRYLGPRSTSLLSPPLVIMTAPLAPSIPVLVSVTSSTLKVKWYAAAGGCFKFVVHMRIANQSNVIASNNARTRATSSNTSSTGSSAMSLTGLDLKDEGWHQMYLGQDPIYTCVTLASETAYEVRVCAVNYQGTLSEPSPVLSFTTLARQDTSSTLTPKNARETFLVECTGDVCVGDTILITERLFMRPQGIQGTTIGVTGSTEMVKGITHPKKPTVNTGGGGTGPFAQQGLNTRSVVSMTGAGGADGGATITSQAGTFLGERTIAAFVARDNYRSTRDVMLARQVGPRDHKEFGAMRRLWLEVVWQRSSTEEVRKYEAKPGEVLERMQAHIEEFEVFRVPWRQENLRKPLQQEWESLKDCFIPML